MANVLSEEPSFEVELNTQEEPKQNPKKEELIDEGTGELCT